MSERNIRRRRIKLTFRAVHARQRTARTAGEIYLLAALAEGKARVRTRIGRARPEVRVRVEDPVAVGGDNEALFDLVFHQVIVVVADEPAADVDWIIRRVVELYPVVRLQRVGVGQ